MTYCSRRTVTNVRSSSQSSLKLSAISTIAYWLPDAARETLANEAAALCLKTALPFTCTLTVNGSTVAGFEQSAFARSVIAFFNEVRPSHVPSASSGSSLNNIFCVRMQQLCLWKTTPSERRQTVKTKTALLVGDTIFLCRLAPPTAQTLSVATIHFKPLLPEVSDALLNGPQLESLHLHFKLSDHRGPTDAAANSSEPICPLSELIQQQPLSLNILCLLERALEKAVAGWSRRMPLVVNAELKEVRESLKGECGWKRDGISCFRMFLHYSRELTASLLP